MLEGYYLRRPAEDDFDDVLALMVSCDVRDVGFPDSDRNDLQSDWERMDLPQDAWVVFNKDHKLQGYGAVLPWSNGKFVGVYDAPGTEDSDLFLGLTILCEGRARMLLGKLKDNDKVTIAHYISDVVDHQKKILFGAGYKLTKFLFNMHRELDGENQAPEWPDGVLLRTINIGVDDRELHNVIQDAFNKPGRSLQSFEEWKSFMMNPVTFIPELWFILEFQSEIIGCALCFEYEELGWVRQLAVRKDLRGKGFGCKLLQQAFSVFKLRGFPKAGLAVEAENVNALKLYTSVGMKKVVHLDEYSKKIVLDS